MAMQVSIMVEGQAGVGWDQWRRLAQVAEDGGFYGLFRSDHFMDFDGRRIDALEPWVSLAWLAGNTKRIAFGPLVSPISFRHPVMLAWQASGIDAQAGGRLRIGLGVGWNVREHEAFGFDLGDLNTRFARFEEGVQVVRLLTRSTEPVSYKGEHFLLVDAYLQPRSPLADGPPIVIGGNGPRRTLPLVARYADEWNGVGLSAADYRERSSRLDELLDGEGRDRDSVKRTLMTRLMVARSEQEIIANEGAEAVERARGRGALVGTPGEIVDQLGRFAEAGVEGIQMQVWEYNDLSALELIASDVLPQLT